MLTFNRNVYAYHLVSTESHDETRIEELHKKRNYLAAYCKLVVYNVIPIKSAADIFKHYLRVRTCKTIKTNESSRKTYIFFSPFQCYNEYGDIIKATMGKAREINKINCALTMCLSLISTYKEIQKANDSIYVSKSSQSFTDLKVNDKIKKKTTSKCGVVRNTINSNNCIF